MSHSESHVPARSPIEANEARGSKQKKLPDIAKEHAAEVQGRLCRVGMSGIEVLVKIATDETSEVCIPGVADAFVNLVEPAAKGIHMSRLLLTLQDTLDTSALSPKQLTELLAKMVKSHNGLSSSAFVAISFQHSIRQEALKSSHSGWRHYPIRIEAKMESGKVTFGMQLQVTYSSTCPCSAALSRQVLQQKFLDDLGLHRWISPSQVNDWLGENGSVATPHSQRSHADVTLRLREDTKDFQISEMISQVESALATPVQAAVKRIDEQEFARLNGANLMFCEDAARRIRERLDEIPEIVDFRCEVSHLESLHAHNAVAVTTKGIQNGMQP